MSQHKKKTQPQAGQYDKIWRENMLAAMPGLIRKVLKIEVRESKDLPDQLLITKEREVDVLQAITDTSGNKFVLHLEIQVKNEPDMVYRMAEYYIMIKRKYRIPVRQFVIYIGSASLKMSSVLKSDAMHFRYNLISIGDISYKLFLSSDVPEEHILAVLGDFGGEQPETVLSAVIEKVQQSAEGEFSGNRYMQQLRMIIQLRNLDKQLDQAMEKVSTFFKEERDPFFQKGKKIGVELGREEGFEKGKDEGFEKGVEQRNQEIVRHLIIEFGFSDEQAASMAKVTIEYVREIRASLMK